jgi:hypothetical protein
MALKAQFWNDYKPNARLDQAANVPFQSLNMGRQAADEGSLAVRALHDALFRIQANSSRLLFPYFPDPTVAGNQWGPFDIDSNEYANASYGNTTRLAVQKFQQQDATLAVDGKAGMKTFGRLDDMLAWLEMPAPSPSPWANMDL